MISIVELSYIGARYLDYEYPEKIAKESIRFFERFLKVIENKLD